MFCRKSKPESGKGGNQGKDRCGRTVQGLCCPAFHLPAIWAESDHSPTWPYAIQLSGPDKDAHGPRPILLKVFQNLASIFRAYVKINLTVGKKISALTFSEDAFPKLH